MRPLSERYIDTQIFAPVARDLPCHMGMIALYSSAVRWLALPIALLAAACGNSTQTITAPSQAQASAPITITATIANTVTGATIGQHVQTVPSFPAQLTIVQAGYVTRQTWVSSAEPRIDLFPEAGFDLAFYRQFLRNGLDGTIQPLRRLTQSPAIYLQRNGLSEAVVAAVHQTALAVIPAFSGGRLQLAGFEHGMESRAARAGWITVELVSEPEGPCGTSLVGASTGRITMNTGRPACDPRPFHQTFAHELGHALGFYHVPNGLMQNPSMIGVSLPSPLERHHAALAYTRLPGNADVDSDSRTGSTFQTMVVVD